MVTIGEYRVMILKVLKVLTIDWVMTKIMIALDTKKNGLVTK